MRRLRRSGAVAPRIDLPDLSVARKRNAELFVAVLGGDPGTFAAAAIVVLGAGAALVRSSQTRASREHRRTQRRPHLVNRATAARSSPADRSLIQARVGERKGVHDDRNLGAGTRFVGSDAVAHVWTNNPDGTPQVSVVWLIAAWRRDPVRDRREESEGEELGARRPHRAVDRRRGANERGYQRHLIVVATRLSILDLIQY